MAAIMPASARRPDDAHVRQRARPRALYLGRVFVHRFDDVPPLRRVAGFAPASEPVERTAGHAC
jgi:hypothetical protein